MLLFGCAITQTGPYAWAAAWQVRRWGGHNALLSFLPGFAALLIPVIVIASLPRRPGWPFVLGAKDAFWGPRVRITVSDTQMVRRMRAGTRWCAALALVSLVVGGLVYAWAMRPGPLPVGTPLPELSIDAAARPGATLPPLARLTGATVQEDAAWSYTETARRTSILITYVPLTEPGWRPGDAVSVLEERRHGVSEPDAAGPLEGTLARGGIPGWVQGAMRQQGLVVVADPVVLTREALGGVVPAPDALTPIFAPVFGTAFALVLGLMAFSFWRAGRKIRLP